VINGHSSVNQKLGIFDFSTGNEDAANKDKGLVTGRMAAFGIRIELIGKTKEHGLRGIELPNGDITFDLELSTVYNKKDVTKDYKPLIYSLDGNMKSTTKSDGRVISLEYAYAPRTPFNKMINQAINEYYLQRTCYDGGHFLYTIEDNVIHVRIKDYKVNLNQLPYNRANNDGTVYYYYNPDEISEYWDIQRAVISSGSVWVVQPFNNSNSSSLNYNKNIVEEYGEGTFSLTMKDNNLAINTEYLQQANIKDDNTTQGAKLEQSGSFSSSISYLKYNFKDFADALTDGAFDNGKDIQLVGKQLRISTIINNDNAEGLNTAIAYDHLIKWDDVFFEPDGKISYSQNALKTNHKYLWAAKPDKTGWNHYGLKPDEYGYDQEMKNAVVDDLIYFESLNALKSNGYIPVAILLENRGYTTEAMTRIFSYIGGTVKKDCPIGYTYMATYTTMGWNKDSIKDLVAEANAIEITSPADYGKLTDAMYDTYAKNNMPSRSDFSVTSYDSYPDSFSVRDATTYPAIKNYQKAKYDENGYVSGSTGRSGGDFLIIL